MPINLQDIRTAVQTYLDTKVAVSISALTPAIPGTINPGETFTFSVTAANATTAMGGIGLMGVRYRLAVVNPAVAKLVAPPPPAKATDFLGATLSPGSDGHSAMILSYPDNRLEPGDTDTISGLKGMVPMGVRAPISTQIRFDILADPDLDYLFPKNENSAVASRTVSVV